MLLSACTCLLSSQSVWIVKLFFFWGSPLSLSQAPSTVYSGYAWACSKSTTSCCVERALIFVDYDSTNFLKTGSLCRVCLCEYVLLLKSSHPLRRRFVRCQVGFVNGNPSGSRSKIRSRKPIWKSGSSSAIYLLQSHDTVEVPMLHNTDHSEVIPETPRVSKLSTSFPWETAKPQDKACFCERIEAPVPPLRPRPKCDFTHPRQLSPFPERLVLPFSNKLSYPITKKLNSSGNDLFTSWPKLSDHEILVQHMVDIEKATAEFREASERKHATSSHMNSCSKRFATRSIVQRRLSIHNWNPGPRR